MSSNKEAKCQRRFNNHLAVMKQLTICKFYDAKINSPIGVFRKRKALNCGRAGCKLCTNPRRLWGHITFSEKKANCFFKYELSDI